MPAKGLLNVVETHNRALHSLANRLDSHRQWSVVAPPHDVTGPPKDLKELPSVVRMHMGQNSKNSGHKGLAFEWAEGFSQLLIINNVNLRYADVYG